MTTRATAGMTIDELARRVGETARNVRAYQARGLLPGPHLQGRVGVYDQGHVERLETVRRLRERGFSLAGIAALLHTWDRGGTLGDLLGVRAGGAVVLDDGRGPVPPALRLALVPGPVARRLTG